MKATYNYIDIINTVQMAEPTQQSALEEEQTEMRIYNYTNGHKYDGIWLNKKKHGKGIFTWRTGEVYDGDYKEDKRHG